jgi:hypothetical protein
MLGKLSGTPALTLMSFQTQSPSLIATGFLSLEDINLTYMYPKT